jgi:hypothetical protein
MDNQKTDELIREKINQLQIFPGNDKPDRQRSWERMQLRLSKPSSLRLNWWKYAAALLILMMGGYALFQLKQMNIPSSAKVEYPEKMEERPEGMKSPEVTRNEGPSPLSPIKKIHGKKVFRFKVKEKGSIVTRTIKANDTNRGGELSPGNKNDSAIENNDHLYANKNENIKAVTPASKSIAIVYYNEIEQFKSSPTAPPETNKRLQIRLNTIENPSTNLLATQHSFINTLKINLSPENQQ